MAAYLPVAHPLHVLDTARAWDLPASQARHSVLDVVFENCPFGHSAQSLLSPEGIPIVPAEQAVQTVSADSLANVPAAQSSQMLFPWLLVNVPEETRFECESFSEVEPAIPLEHLEHSLLPADDTNFPAAHLLQIVPRTSSEYRPAPQFVHFVRPSELANFPAGQSEQTDIVP